MIRRFPAGPWLLGLLASCAASPEVGGDGGDSGGAPFAEDAAPAEVGTAPEPEPSPAADDGGPRTADVTGGVDSSPETSGGDAPDPGAPAFAIEVPSRVLAGVPYPFVVRGDPALSGVVEVAGVEVRLHRGTGSAAVSDGIGGAAVVAGPDRTVSGTLAGDDLVWGPDECVAVPTGAVVPKGATLHVHAGTLVVLGPKASLEVAGAIVTEGAHFTRKEAEPWGQVRVSAGATAAFSDTWLTAGGGDPSKSFGHSKSQPVVLVDGGELTMTGGGIVDAPGKAFGSSGARVTLDGVLVSRVDTGGELTESHVIVDGGRWLEIPDADGVFDDDDNDALYLKGALLEGGAALESRISDTVFSLGEDDAIDHNDAEVLVERVVIEGFRHEGVAASVGRRITIRDSFVRGCEQGIEAGYGSPEVVVEHTTITECQVGLRFGDSYDWETSGHLSAMFTASVGNHENVLNLVLRTGKPDPEGVEIACSLVDTPGFDGEDGNLAGPAEVDAAGCVPKTACGERIGPETYP